MSDIFVRAFTDNKNDFKENEEETHNHNIRLIIDTETTIDQYQNLTFGSWLIQTQISSGFKEEWYIFYGNITENEIEIIKDYGKEHNIKVLPVREFVESVFFPYAYKMRCEVIGFNLPFDLSRLSIDYGIARKKEDAFSVKLSEDKRNPRIRIQSIDQKRSFIEFTTPLRKKRDKKYKAYRGYFVDLKTLTFALTDKSHTLDSACESFNVSRKLHTEEHGKITKEYIKYNLNDVKITAELYQKALERYRMFNLPDPVNRLYSPASIGKAYLRKMNIKPFLEQNQDFPKEILGYAMSSYYGGRTEVRIRNKSIPITYLDFTSMYPTVYSLLQLDKFLKAKKITHYENTENVKRFIEELKSEYLRNPETWQRNEMHSIVRIRPNEDILPVRMEYSKIAKNIGINYLSSNEELWYSIEDVIASKLLTGKTPEIVQAITFIPDDKQDNLKDVNISDITIHSNEDFIRKLIEERMKVKKSNRPDRDQIQLILKIIANATSYGIYIEENAESLSKYEDVDVYSIEQFKFHTNKIEKQGSYFNPIMATLITGSARLILAIAESIAVKDGYIAYMDTDSMFVSPNKVKEIQDFFRPLNPYSLPVEMFKIEEDGNHKPLDNVMFYGMSAKRYCLYRIDNNQIKILKYSTHGLGHLLNIDGEQVWKDILIKNFREYSDKIAVSQITVSKPSILKRFKKMNFSKPIEKQIKPFNFMLVGSEKNDVIPCLPYDKDISGIQYKSFIDYKTDTTSDKLPLPSKEYWYTLEDVLTSYVRHNDNKFDYDNEGIAHRKHIIADRIRYIGKETNNLDEVEITGLDGEDYLE
ncbi:MAG: hypothetical protein F9Y92_07145 [Thermoplasmatales archaeon]|nr:hypothetical protein [Thermoplasmatales archaeon]